MRCYLSLRQHTVPSRAAIKPSTAGNTLVRGGARGHMQGLHWTLQVPLRPSCLRKDGDACMLSVAVQTCTTGCTTVLQHIPLTTNHTLIAAGPAPCGAAPPPARRPRPPQLLPHGPGPAPALLQGRRPRTRPRPRRLQATWARWARSHPPAHPWDCPPERPCSDRSRQVAAARPPLRSPAAAPSSPGPP